ncbi:MAG: retroviral-like aspartic protease family protein [Tepidiformaceae bacterium]
MSTATIAPRFLRHPSPEPFMGEVSVRVQLENWTDRDNVLRGLAREEDVRRTELDIVVDTGATQLVLPEEVVRELGLTPMGTTRVSYADDRTEERPVAGIVTVLVEGRQAPVPCVVGHPGTEPLLGQIVLEMTDLLVDCARQRLVPNPESPDKPHYKIK